jgi:hypothetical protein
MNSSYLKLGSAFCLMGCLLSCSSGKLSETHRTPASIFPEVAGTTEGGALPLNESFQSISLQAGSQAIAYQVESYGGTVLSFKISAPAITVSGPWVDLAGNSLQNPATLTSAQGKYTLTQPGVYRVVVTSEFSGTVTCEKSCARPSVAVSAYFQELKAAGKLNLLTDIVNAKLATVISDANLRADLTTKLQTILASANYSELDRFPLFDLNQLGKIRIPLAAVAEHADPSAPTPPASVIHDELENLLGSCNTARTLPDGLTPSLPGVMYGDYNNMAMSDCQFDRSTKLANILTSLGAGNGSVVSYQGQNLTTASALMNALIQSGHHVEMRNERTYANFLSFMIGEPSDPNSRNLKWPTWVKTGIILENGQELVVPMGHSQHAWHITGPLVNANVTFYLGITGTGFFAQTSVRAGWTGLRTLYQYSSDTGGTATILKALDFAGVYFKRNLYESSHIAKGLPADGYGYLGVCNDSTALLEDLYQNSVSEYPLVRARSLLQPSPLAYPVDQSNPLDVQLDAALKNLPSDADAFPSPSVARGRLSILNRIAQMTPYSFDSPQMIDDVFKSELQEVLKENPKLSTKFP